MLKPEIVTTLMVSWYISANMSFLCAQDLDEIANVAYVFKLAAPAFVIA